MRAPAPTDGRATKARALFDSILPAFEYELNVAPVPPDASRSSFDGAKSIVAQPIATSATATAAIGFACEYATACAP